jgi:type I restriction enzyme S subunit
MQAGKFVSASNISERSEEALFPCYGGNGLRGYTETHTHNGTYPLIGRQGALCGNVRLVSGHFHATEHAVVATPKEAVDVGWLYYALDLLNLNRFATGQAQPGLSVDVLENVSLAIPPLEIEQQKIAECLSSVDELMAAQARKVDALKTHKKGLMQQLFPREGETQPRLRFPEFQNAEEWEERLLESFIEEFRGKSNIQDEYEVMTSARSGLVRQRDYYDNDRIAERDNIGFNVIPPNYMTYRSRSDDRQFYFNENNLGITGIVSVYYPVFRAVSGSNKFLIELLSAFSRVVGKYSVGTSQTVLSLNQLGRIRLPFPPTAKEQQRIASCLSSLDELITLETQKLEALKTHKKGLMQQLFPSPEEAEA